MLNWLFAHPIFRKTPKLKQLKFVREKTQQQKVSGNGELCPRDFKILNICPCWPLHNKEKTNDWSLFDSNLRPPPQRPKNPHKMDSLKIQTHFVKINEMRFVLLRFFFWNIQHWERPFLFWSKNGKVPDDTHVFPSNVPFLLSWSSSRELKSHPCYVPAFSRATIVCCKGRGACKNDHSGIQMFFVVRGGRRTSWHGEHMSGTKILILHENDHRLFMAKSAMMYVFLYETLEGRGKPEKSLFKWMSGIGTWMGKCLFVWEEVFLIRMGLGYGNNNYIK